MIENRTEVHSGPKVSTGFANLDKLLGNGLEKGKVVTLAAGPGVGKTTLLLQLGTRTSEHGSNTLFCSGEMSPALVSEYLDRYRISDTMMHFTYETSVVQLAKKVQSKGINILLIDSLQTLHLGDHRRPSTGQLLHIARALINIARQNDVCIVAICQQNKDGSINGPNGMLHDVDAIFRMDRGDNSEVIVSAVKNRQSSISDARAVFRKTPRGLVQVEEIETGYLLRHQQKSKVMTLAFPYTGKNGTTVEEISFVPNLNETPHLAIEGFSSASTRFLEDLCVSIFPNIGIGVRIRANNPRHIDRGAELAVLVGLCAFHLGTILSPDIVFCGSIDAEGRIMPVNEMQTRMTRATAQGYKRLIGPHPIGSAEPEWEAYETISDVLDAVGIQVDC